MRKEKRTITVSVSSAYRLLHPKLAVLLTCVDKEGKANIITLAWTMTVSMKPPLLAVSISPKGYSHKMIEDTKEFVINIPIIEFVKETLFCGRRSGREVDKFIETKFTPISAKIVKAPVIKECVAHIECKLYRRIPAGDHTLFISEAQAAYVDKNVFSDEYNLEKAKLIFHLGGDKFTVVSTKVVKPPLSNQQWKSRVTF
jgi:flavin reductase (DIM6/NTAB) family NADH-FMN oxidoreductase RutF